MNVERQTQVIHSETPFRELGVQISAECNEIVRPVTDTLIKHQFLDIDWESTYDPEHFILAACVLKEIVDDPFDIYVNTQVPYHEADPNTPELFAISANFNPTDQNFGIVSDHTLWSADDVDYAPFVTLSEFIRQRASLSTDKSSFSLLLECCEQDVDHIHSTNPFKKYLSAPSDDGPAADLHEAGSGL